VGLEGRWIEVDHGRRALAHAARLFYGKPDEQVALTGITGTTENHHRISDRFRAARGGIHNRPGGTIEYRLAGRVLPAVNTTPESLDLIRLLAELRAEGGTHATWSFLARARTGAGIRAAVPYRGVHQPDARPPGFHVTMEAYFAAKQKLFAGEGGEPPAFAVLNRDDSYSRALHIAPETRVFCTGSARTPTCARCTSSPEASGCASTSSMASSVSRWNRR